VQYNLRTKQSCVKLVCIKLASLQQRTSRKTDFDFVFCHCKVLTIIFSSRRYDVRSSADKLIRFAFLR